MHKIMAFSFVFLLVSCSPTTPNTPEVELNETIDEIILLIDDGNSQEILAKYADISSVSGPITEIPEEALKRLKTYLLKIRDVGSVLTINEGVATYSIPNTRQKMHFIRSGDRWLLQNN